MIQDQPNNKQQPRVKCPKGTKVPKAVKCQAAMLFGTNKLKVNEFQRSMGIAIHEAAYKVKSANKADRSRTSTGAASVDTE